MASVSMRGCLVVLLAFIAVGGCFSNSVHKEWKTFKLEHNKSYASKQHEKFRLKIFKKNKDFIARHNALYRKGAVSFMLGLNSYADMLHHEFVKTVHGFNNTLLKLMKQKGLHVPTFRSSARVKVHDKVDWRKKGAVTPVKFQGNCGACWAFSTTGALEGRYFRKTGKLVSLSEQNLVDCSHRYGNNGCDGGLMDNAFTYVKENHGIDTEKSYPYKAHDYEKCRYKASAKTVTVRGFHNIAEGDEEALKHALATIGPVSVAIDASQPSFHMYRKGVYYDENCSSEDLTHAVLAVGYGTTKRGKDYWIVKNSWGRHWGEEGYVRIARNRDNACGIATAASYPI